MKRKKILIFLLILLLSLGYKKAGGSTTDIPESSVSESAGEATKTSFTEKETSKIPPVTLKFKNAFIKDVFEILSKMTGVNIFFDATVPNQKINVYIDSLPFEKALDVLLKTNDLVKVDVDKNSIIVVPRTGERIKNYQDMVIRTFYLTNSEAKDMVNLLKTMVQTKQIFVNERLNAIVVRDTKENIKLSEDIIEANDKLGTQVDIELELVEVDRNKLEDIGLKLGGDKIAGASLKELNLENNFNVRRSLGVTLPGIWYDLTKDKSTAKILANPRVRVTNKQKAKVMIADRVPVEINTIEKDTSGRETTRTQVEYKDVGIKLDVEPTIHLDDNVTVKLTLEVSSIVEYTAKGYPLIRTRNVESFIRLKDGETKILGGLISDEERKGASEIPLLSKIPFLGTIFTSRRDQKVGTEIVMRLTPYIVEKMKLAEKDKTPISSSEMVSAINTVGISRSSETLPAGREEKINFSKDEPKEKIIEGSVGAPQELIKEEGIKTEEKKEDKPVQPDTSATIYINPEIKEVKVGEEFSLDINAGNVNDLFAAPFYLLYDSKVLRFVSAKEGKFLSQNGVSTTFLFSNDSSRSRVIIGLTRLGQVGGISGSGALMTVNFSAVEKGNSNISFQNASAKKASKEDLTPGTLSVTFKGCEVNVK